MPLQHIQQRYPSLQRKICMAWSLCAPAAGQQESLRSYFMLCVSWTQESSLAMVLRARAAAKSHAQ